MTDPTVPGPTAPDPIVPDPIVTVLDAAWASLVELAASLRPEEWDAPTDLPGWTVRDVVAHVIGTERGILGDAPPELDVRGYAHVRNPVGAANERWVASRRGLPGEAVLAELREVTARRSAELHAMAPDAFERIVPNPIGEGTYREWMAIRVLDVWTHEQDVRRAVGRPGHDRGPVAELALARLRSALPVVVGKRAAVPEGASVVLDAGPGAATVALAVVDGRARPVDPAPAAPTVRLTMDPETYWCLTTGRLPVADALAAARVRVEGDAELGRRVLDHLNIMI